MKYLLLLIGLVGLQFSTSYCCFHCNDDDSMIFNNRLSDDPMVDQIIKYTDGSYWVYKEQTSGKLDTIKVINYSEDIQVEYGTENNTEYTKKVITLHSSLNQAEFNIGILKPIPDDYTYLSPILFKGKAGISGQKDVVEEIIYFYAPQAKVKEQTIDLDKETLGVSTNRFISSASVNGKEYSNVTRIINTQYPNTPQQSINSYYYSADYGLIKYVKSTGETWELVAQSIVKREEV